MKGYYKQVVDNTARLTADICERKSIPAEALTAQQLRTGQRGVISHNLSRIVYGGTDHTDPGQHFPWSTFMGLVRSYSQKSALKRVEPIDHSVTPCTQVLASMQPYAVVQGFYRMYLKRDGSKDEIGYWLARDRGWDAAVIEEIRLSIAASEEAQSHLH